MLSTHFDRLRLHDLTHVNEGLKIFWLAIVAQDVSKNALVPAVVLLVRLHGHRPDVIFLRQRELTYGLHLGKGLKAELGHEARVLFGVFFNRLQRVPYAPVVHVTVLLSLRHVVKVRARRAGPVGDRITILTDSTLEDVTEQDD